MPQPTVSDAEKRIIADWVKKSTVIGDQGLSEWRVANDRGLQEWRVANERGLQEWRVANERGLQEWRIANASHDSGRITEEQADALKTAAQRKEDAVKALAQQREEAAKAAAKQREDTAKTVAQQKEDTAKNKIFTQQIAEILDKELAMLAGPLQAVGYGRVIGNKNGRIDSLTELKEALSYDGRRGLYQIDDNQDGLLALDEAKRHLPALPKMSGKPVQLQH